MDTFLKDYDNLEENYKNNEKIILEKQNTLSPSLRFQNASILKSTLKNENILESRSNSVLVQNINDDEINSLTSRSNRSNDNLSQ